MEGQKDMQIVPRASGPNWQVVAGTPDKAIVYFGCLIAAAGHICHAKLICGRSI